MAEVSLAVKYRPKTFSDVSEQSEVITILEQQLKTETTKNAYLFCGGAGTGKTTCARIFANEINKGKGNPTELDAASNNSVDDIRLIIEQAKMKSLDSEYRVFIIDECHALSNNAWQALLKLLEEPPKQSIFILCTTDPQKIPQTILSRVQRFDFKRISQQGIVNRLFWILEEESGVGHHVHDQRDPEMLSAIEYIAKIADGGMRSAITTLDKCLAFSTEITLENVVKVIGATNYAVYFDLTNALTNFETKKMLTIINDLYSSGKDLKLFIKGFMEFILDVCKYDVTQSFDYIRIPAIYDEDLKNLSIDYCNRLLEKLITLNAEIKWESNPKAVIEATFYMECMTNG